MSEQTLDQLKRTVFLTNAASDFGQPTALLFHEKGWNVIAALRPPEKESELPALSGVLVTRLDTTDQHSINEAVQVGIRKFGRIDALVNDTGFGTLGVLEAAPGEVIRQQFEVNFFGMIGVIKAVLPGMRAHKSGTIVNISSVGGKATFPFCTLFHATKFAVEGLTESLQYELNPLGIKLKLVEPGGYKTDFVAPSNSSYGAGGIEDYQQSFDRFIGKLQQSPLSENFGEVAEAIYEAATDGTEKLRYPVGNNAAPLMNARHQMDDIAFKKMMASQTGI